MAGRQVSRLWVRRYEQPRDEAGRFVKGSQLYTRYDGAHRYLRFSLDTSDDVARAIWLTDEARRVFRDLFVILVAALLIWWFG